MSARKRLLAMAAGVTMWATLQPGTVSAQNSGIGGDGFTRLMWRSTNYSIALWNLDANLNVTGSLDYGPYVGWIPIAMTTNSLSYTYVLWRRTDGAINLWELDPVFNMVNQHIYGPYTGWIAKGLSAGTGGGANLRVVWRYTDGTATVWNVDSNLNFVSSQVYGPFSGWDAGYMSE
jgi:hypothetical protein